MLKSPQPDQVKETRKALGFTQKESAEMVHSSPRAWQLWEAGDRTMPPGIWELFVIKTGLHPLYGARSYQSAVYDKPAISGPLGYRDVSFSSLINRNQATAKTCLTDRD